MSLFEILDKPTQKTKEADHNKQISQKYKQQLTQESDHFENFIYFAETAIKEHQFQKAQECLLRAIDKYPHEAHLYFHLANTLVALGQQEQAVNYFFKTLTLNPKHAKACNNLGRLFHKKKYFSKAHVYYQKAIQYEPDYTEALYNLGLLFVSTNRLLEAKQQFESILRSNPNLTFVCEQLAQLAWRTHDLKGAVKYYLQLLEQSPRDSDAWNNVGALRLQMKETASAIDCFKKALTYYPKHTHARSNIAALYLQQNQLKEAIWEYSLYLRLEPKDAEAYYNLGVALMLSGQLKEAVDAFQATIKLNEAAVEAWVNLGAIYIRIQNFQQAYDSYQKIIVLQPNHAIGQFMLSALTQSSTVNTTPLNFKYDIPKKAPLIYIKNLFNTYASHFDQHLIKELNYQVPQAIYQLLSPYLKERASYSILDLGCGTGLSGALFQSTHTVITGVDIASQMLVQAAKKNIYHHLIEMDIMHFLNSSSKTYDVILCVDTLVYFGELLPLFQKIERIIQGMAYFALSIETYQRQTAEKITPSQGYYHLQVSGRYQHEPEAVVQLAQYHGWQCLQQSRIQGRLHNHQPTEITIFLLQKKGSRHPSTIIKN